MFKPIKPLQPLLGINAVQLMGLILAVISLILVYASDNISKRIWNEEEAAKRNSLVMKLVCLVVAVIGFLLVFVF